MAYERIIDEVKANMAEQLSGVKKKVEIEEACMRYTVHGFLSRYADKLEREGKSFNDLSREIANDPSRNVNEQHE